METIKDTISFHDFKALVKENKTFGFVIMGAGGDIQEWLTGIEEILKKENMVTQEGDTFSRAAKLTGNVNGEDGRTDYVFLFTDTAKPEVGRLAIWRLTFGGISWMDDFMVNYAKDYNDVVPSAEKKVKLELVGLDGNAYSLMGAFRRQARKEKWPPEEIKKVLDDAQSSDYNHLLATLADHCESPLGDEDEEQYG